MPAVSSSLISSILLSANKQSPHAPSFTNVVLLAPFALSESTGRISESIVASLTHIFKRRRSSEDI